MSLKPRVLLKPCTMALSPDSTLQVKVLLLFLNASFLLILLSYCMISIDTLNTVVRKLIIIVSKELSLRSPDDLNEGCSDVYKAKCTNSAAKSWCEPQGYVNYLYLFYCACGEHPMFGYTLLGLWLVVLFYLLANTSANYFCTNLEGLSALLNLSPTIAGVTLLSLGNGAPDAFSSMVSFMGAGTDDLGLNSALGGVFFVSCVVIGVISISISHYDISINRACFFRDLCFLLFVLLALLVVIFTGKINVWGAMAFTFLYLVYVLLVGIRHLFSLEDQEKSTLNTYSQITDHDTISCIREHEEIDPPLLVSSDMPQPFSALKSVLFGSGLKATWSTSAASDRISRVLYCLELPLYLPRRLTIPDVCKERWSKPFAVTSVTLAPILLSVLWNSKRKEIGSEESLLIYFIGGFIGLVLGIAALLKTNKDGPPTTFLLPWLAGGFLMSITWTYIIAQELVSLLVSLGVVLNISPSVLGLTVLAWGNSLGDLISSLVMAMNGGRSGVQVAISGCYGGPIFNTLVGLGISLVFATWVGHPSSQEVIIPKDPTLYQTLGFLITGLLWALMILPKRGMRPDKVLGSGLLCIYLCFLSVSLLQSFGVVRLQ